MEQLAVPREEYISGLIPCIRHQSHTRARPEQKKRFTIMDSDRANLRATKNLKPLGKIMSKTVKKMMMGSSRTLQAQAQARARIANSRVSSTTPSSIVASTDSIASSVVGGQPSAAVVTPASPPQSPSPSLRTRDRDEELLDAEIRHYLHTPPPGKQTGAGCRRAAAARRRWKNQQDVLEEGEEALNTAIQVFFLAFLHRMDDMIEQTVFRAAGGATALRRLAAGGCRGEMQDQIRVGEDTPPPPGEDIPPSRYKRSATNDAGDGKRPSTSTDAYPGEVKKVRSDPTTDMDMEGDDVDDGVGIEGRARDRVNECAAATNAGYKPYLETMNLADTVGAKSMPSLEAYFG